MVISELYHSSISYIENESAHHGGKTIFVISEIQRLQYRLLGLNQIYSLSKDIYNKEEKKLLISQTQDIANTITQLQNTYGLSVEELKKIEAKFANVNFWN